MRVGARLKEFEVTLAKSNLNKDRNASNNSQIPMKNCS